VDQESTAPDRTRTAPAAPQRGTHGQQSMYLHLHPTAASEPGKGVSQANRQIDYAHTLRRGCSTTAPTTTRNSPLATDLQLAVPLLGLAPVLSESLYPTVPLCPCINRYCINRINDLALVRRLHYRTLPTALRGKGRQPNRDRQNPEQEEQSKDSRIEPGPHSIL
jgi:hypothetical protein